MTYTRPGALVARRYNGRSRMNGMSDPLDDILTMVGLGPDPAPQPASSALPTDNVNQTTGGGTSTSASDFTTVSGVCKPQNFPALTAVRVLQQQLNRVAQVKGLGKISVDGAIGPGTLALFRQVQSASAGSVMGDATTCMGIAPDVDVLGAQVKDLADTLGAPESVSGPIGITVPTILTKSGKTLVAPDGGMAASLASMSSIEKMALLGVAGAIGYLLWGKQKKRRKWRPTHRRRSTSTGR